MIKLLALVFVLSVFSIASAQQKEEEEMKSFSGQTPLGGTQAEACSSAKKNAEFWANLNRYKITNFSSCDCSEKWDAAFKQGAWFCNLNATLKQQ